MELIRAFELPLSGLVRPDDQDAPDDRADLWPLLRECWRRATDLANWCVLELVRRDVTRIPGMERRPDPPVVNGKKLKGLYGLASETFGFKAPGSWWTSATRTAATICRDVEGAYRKARDRVLWRRCESLRTYRYPYPWPVHGQGWKLAWFDAGGRPCVRVALPGGQVDLRLRGGPEFGRQLGHFRDVVRACEANAALPAKERERSFAPQLVIREQPCGANHRPGLVEKAPGGGQRRPHRVMVKMVCTLPAREKLGDRVLTLLTNASAFWVAELDGRPAWVLNADHVRRMYEWLAVHEDRLARYAQDTKAERRLDSDKLRQLNESRERCCLKHARRVSSWLHEIAAQLANYAARQRVGMVQYLDHDHGFVPRFPWHRLKTLLGDKLAAAGIVLRCASDGEGEVTVA